MIGISVALVVGPINGSILVSCRTQLATSARVVSSRYGEDLSGALSTYRVHRSGWGIPFLERISTATARHPVRKLNKLIIGRNLPF